MIISDDTLGLLKSLEYLSNEADSSGNEQICKILQSAIDSIIGAEALITNKDKDTQKALEFLQNFQQSSPDVRKKVISLISTFDLSNETKFIQ